MSIKALAQTRRKWLSTTTIFASSCLWLSYVNAALKTKSSSIYWRNFKSQYISADGRVISDDGGLNRTYSEGQAYALFFALVFKDRAMFEQLLQWTQNNLCQGDLSKQLPSWLWGRNDQGDWSVLDVNSASDADVWLAYTLLEAGQIFKHKPWSDMGRSLSSLILQQETMVIPGLGRSLLPGKQGFHESGTYKLNPSYYPLQLLQRLGAEDAQWLEIYQSSLSILTSSSPKGVAPDWILYEPTKGFFKDEKGEANGRGGYNAIRVYLWIGMLPPSQPVTAQLLRHFSRFAHIVQALEYPPEYIDPWSLAVEGQGSWGFKYAVLPFMQRFQSREVIETWQSQANAEVLATLRYYPMCLHLFASAWIDGRYEFTAQGNLKLHDQNV